MEYLFVIIASALAGIGTGLVGLSAATAMVPILIVLCPSFGGEHGVYMATAIALASDILGSLVTTVVYAKNKRIDLKHGWIMLVCIVGMCILGSVAAFFTHQTVLGSFSLILCVAIGIRFLVKPGSKNEDGDEKKDVTMSAKKIAVSLFFGLTIGFGTGYFGTGGGMMMLIVFTAMLGYDRRTAVGTSTFIMTFTALIASVSHILIEPSIVFECWDFLIISIITATLFSLVSARFANKVNARAVGLVTGWILLLLGLSMLALNYREAILSIVDLDLLLEFLRVFGIYVGSIAGCAIILLVLRFTINIPDYIFRKLLHTVAYGSIIPLVLCADIWWISFAVEIFFLILIIVALLIARRLPIYSHIFVEKRQNEVIISFVTLFGLMAAMIALLWGLATDEYKYIIITAIFAWGPGDAMAAIIGKLCGKHKLKGRLIEGTKSVEGTVAMALTSFACTLVSLLLLTSFPWYISLLFAFAVAPLAALTELFTKRGFDTITVPFVSALVLCVAMLI
ncbi:MAG: TSUP family transporter [Clostridia bacterium]|nr:TSUP family transporter [Clostridia bacterium]